MKSFQDVVVVVTGAGSGIGRATSVVFARLGAKVVLADWKEDGLAKVSDEISSEGGFSSAFNVDVSKSDQMKSFAEKVVGEFGQVDVVVNNAGVLILGEMRHISLKEFSRAMDINFWGVIHGIHFFLPHMIERQQGHIVNISSTNALVPLSFSSAYNASKAAVISVSETLRTEIAHHGIGVTTVCPGLTQTDLFDNAKYITETEATRKFLNNYRKYAKQKGVDPFKVAKKIPPAILRNRAVVLVSAETYILSWIYRFWPGLYRFGAKKVVKKTT